MMQGFGSLVYDRDNLVVSEASLFVKHLNDHFCFHGHRLACVCVEIKSYQMPNSVLFQMPKNTDC